MKKSVLIAVAALSFAGGAAFAAKVHDWKDLDKVHTKIVGAIKDMDKARAANHFDMDGHGEKAVQHLKDAEAELKAAVESAKKAK
jgi:hypothetical protein